MASADALVKEATNEMKDLRYCIRPRLFDGSYPRLWWVPFYNGFTVEYKKGKKIEEFKTRDLKEAVEVYLST